MATIFDRARQRRDAEGEAMERGEAVPPAGMTRAEFEEAKKKALVASLRSASAAEPAEDPLAVARKNRKRVPYVVPR